MIKPEYEIQRDNINNLYINQGINLCYPHFHEHIELLCVIEGEKYVTINNKSFNLKSGMVAIADSFDIHSYPIHSEIKTCTVIIPYKYLVEYRLAKKGLYLSDYFVTNTTQGNEIIAGIENLAQNQFQNELILKGYINIVLGKILEAIPLTKRQAYQDTEFIRKLFIYIDNNLTEDLSLNTLSEHFGYSKYHFSRLFNSFFKLSLTDYINSRRIKMFIKLMMENTKMKLSDAIFSAGFSSIQTFYRVFKDSYGVTPKEYLKNF